MSTESRLREKNGISYISLKCIYNSYLLLRCISKSLNNEPRQPAPVNGWHLQIWPARLLHTARHGSLSGRPKRTQRRCRHPDDTPRCGVKDESRSHLSTNLFKKKHPIIIYHAGFHVWHSKCQYGIKSLFFKISSKYTWQILKAWGLAPIPQGAVHG